MALDSATTAPVRTGARLLTKPALAFLRAQIARRGAEFADLATLAGADRELDEAIAVLRGASETLPAYLLTRLKGFLSARPDTFANEDARRFIEDARVDAAAKSGARRAFRDEDIDEERVVARAVHAELFGGDGLFGETLIEDAIGFAAMTLLAHLTPADRLTIELLSEMRAEIHERFDRLEIRLDGLGAAADIEAAPFDAIVEAETRKLARQRLLLIPDLADRALALGARIEAGLHLAAPERRARAFREIAVVLARAERVEEAVAWIDKAEVLGADVTCERARIEMAHARFDEALRMLRDRPDPLSVGLLLDAIARRDDEAAAIAHYETQFGPHDLTGHALQVMARRLEHADRRGDALQLLEAASPVQIDENPLLLFVRARVRIAQAVPADVGDRLLRHEGMVPKPSDLHGDAEGRRRLAEARADLEQFEPALGGLDAPELSALVDINRLFLGLCAPDSAERELARGAFVARLRDPTEDTMLLPLATLYGIDFDWRPLKARLAEAEQLGGYDDIQLRAAFALAMEEGDPVAIAAFVHRYRDRLEPFASSDSVVGIEVEALARSGDLDGARRLLEAERAQLGEAVYASLEAMLAEAEGGDSVAVRLAQFEASQSSHDLALLADAMRREQDPRLGETLIQLWEMRRQLNDARHACDVLLIDGEELRAEAFLESLGYEARADPVLHVHLAWGRFRQGRLAEAETELRALVAQGVDNPNTRQLRVMLLIETGRWAELEPFVQEQLAASADRSAEELIGVAKLARTIGSSVTLDLLRAAVAKAPAEAAINLAAYTIATEAGLERRAEVNRWFAAAIADPGDAGLVRTGDMDEVIAMLTESRAQADRISGMVNAADIPMFMAMQAMGGTQSALLLRQLPANAEQTDSRRRTLVPLFAGNRGLRGDLRPSSVAFEPLSLLVLDYLGLLETALSAFDDVVLPSGTLRSFFEDRGKAVHTQPSRVAQARALKDRASSGMLQVETFAPVSDEAGEVDAEFAMLFAAAEARDGYVIDKAPLHPPGRLDTIVDPAPYAHRLVSPRGLVAKLLAMGAISRATAEAAEPFVAAGGEAWEDEPVPLPGKPLFITGLALQYLTDAGLLPVLKWHAGTLVIAAGTIALADREIAAGEAAAEVRDGIDRIRAVLAEAIATARARVGPARRFKEEKDEDGASADRGATMGPVVSMLRDSAGADAFVCDDRAINKHLQVTDRTGRSLAFLATPDLLLILHGLGVIDDLRLQAAREKLRIVGAGLMPLDPEELARAALESDWAVGPNAELRAIRDSIHVPLARRVLQLPNERPWFRTIAIGTAFAIRSAWREIADADGAERAANWLLDLIPDPEAWSESDESPDRAFWIQDVTRHILWALASMFDLPEARVERFRNWFDRRVLPDYSRHDPGAIDAVARTLYTFLTRELDEERDDDAA